jgi:hypothetical protein
MSQCSDCCRFNRVDAQFCHWCGRQQNTSIQTIDCNKCHATNDSMAKFCLACGCVIRFPSSIGDMRVKQDLILPSSSIIANVSATIDAILIRLTRINE